MRISLGRESLSQDKVFLVLLGALVLLYFFFIGNSLEVQPGKFTSPDETANAFFSSKVTKSTTLRVKQDAIIVHPRSFAVNNGTLVPSTFLGLPVYYGFLGKIFGVKGITWSFALLLIAGVASYYVILREFFSIRISRISALLLLVQPAFLFYALRPYWHNAAFVAWVFIASSFTLFAFRTGAHKWYFAAGVAVGFALAFRGVEALWLLPVHFVIGYALRRRLKLELILFWTIGFALPLLPVVFFQLTTFQQGVLGAYAQIRTVDQGPTSISLFGKLISFIIPWGFHPIRALMNVWQFGFGMMFSAMGLGIIAVMMPKHRRKPYTWFLVAMTTWLGLYYGSFSFVEYVFDPRANLLGSSYLRYWILPIAFSIPLAAELLFWIASFFGSLWRKVLLIALFSIIAITSMLVVVADPQYGVVVTKTTLAAEYGQKLEAVLNTVPPNGVVIAGPDDKIYFPDRQVIGFGYGPMPQALIGQLPKLVEKQPVFYATEFSNDVSEQNLLYRSIGLQWRLRKEIRGNYALYELVKKDAV